MYPEVNWIDRLGLGLKFFQFKTDRIQPAWGKFEGLLMSGLRLRDLSWNVQVGAGVRYEFFDLSDSAVRVSPQLVHTKYENIQMLLNLSISNCFRGGFSSFSLASDSLCLDFGIVGLNIGLYESGLKRRFSYSYPAAPKSAGVSSSALTDGEVNEMAFWLRTALMGVDGKNFEFGDFSFEAKVGVADLLSDDGMHDDLYSFEWTSPDIYDHLVINTSYSSAYLFSLKGVFEIGFFVKEIQIEKTKKISLGLSKRFITTYPNCDFTSATLEFGW